MANLPPLAQPKNGAVDPSTQRRQLFFEKRVPSALAGELLVDGETAVVLKAKLEGKLEVPSTEKEKGATVRLTLDSALTEIGTDPKLKAPEEFLPDQDRPNEGVFSLWKGQRAL